MNQFQLKLPEELQSDLNFIKSELQELKKNWSPKEPVTYITRKQLANRIHSNISTIHNLTVKGVFQKYQVGGKILYRLDEAEKAIVKLKK